jgi:putative hydrolase of the HAD superfamily
MIVVFDLDDTLYDEKTFVYSGLKEVSKWISLKSNFEQSEIFDFMVVELLSSGRGRIFNNALERYFKFTQKNLRKCISIYRLHIPDIKLKQEAIDLLMYLKGRYPLYIVTDGNKIVQNNKIKALNIEFFFKKVFITYRYGLKHSKPSIYCFEIIKKIEKTKWENIMYIGDNPNKDFVNLNKLNVKTVRILQGEFSTLNVSSEFDAKFRINNIGELKQILKNKL